MYLRALEIQGFKSFPDKTVLSFDKDITAIVGPNGSGKSNIADAIRWVMGEMSTKALRGGKMEDVIFAGTSLRPRVGYAEVCLVIDNSEGIFPVEGSEIMVTRRLFRSGESEYYINRQSARLKDVNELFFDTGLGKEGYSLVSQGKIDEILSVKSTDRREIFEAAAGISKFRHRKEETERRLKTTDENLIRINDKIAELELSVGPLREQAATAKRYLILRDELRGIEVALWLDTLEKHRQSAKKALADYEYAASELETANKMVETLYAEVERISGQMREKDIKADDLREKISGLEAALAQHDSEIAVLSAGLAHNRENIERMNREMSEKEDRSGNIGSQISQRRARIDEIQTLLAEIYKERSALTERADELSDSAGSIDAQIAALRAGETDKRLEGAEKTSELRGLAGAAQELIDRETALERDLSELQGRLDEAQKTHDACLEQYNAAVDAAQSAANTVRGFELRNKTRQDTATELLNKRMKLEMELGTLSSRIDMLTEMEREFDGYTKSVKTVMAQSRRGVLKNICGPVSGLIKTKDEYTVAIETALGTSMQSIVVETAEDGRAAIELLKTHDSGRATFLPITSIQGRSLSERGVENSNGYIGVASQLVEFEPKYKDIFTNLLGRTVVAEDLKSAIAIAKAYSNRFRIVTLDGQVINAGGSMTGGSASKSAGILSRANELEKLSAQRKTLAGDYDDIKKQADEANRLAQAAKYELTTATEQLRTAEDETLRLRGEKSRCELLIENLAGAQNSNREQAADVKNRIDANTVRIETVREQIRKLSAEADALAESARQLSGGRQSCEAESKELQDRVFELRERQAALEAEKDAVCGSITELENLHTALSGDHAQYMAQIESIERSIREMNEKSDLLRGERASLTAQIEEHKAALNTVNTDKLALEGERNTIDRRSQDKNKELLNLEREAARLEQKKATAVLEEKQILDKLWDTYELTTATAENVRAEIESTAKATKAAAALKKEISALGSPNIGAIEEFERVNTRYEYLSTQRDDVQSAKRDLEKIVRDITNEMKLVFAEQFEVIAESFSKTFLEIFGGGKGEIVLENPDDILECGIDIRVQLPGKKLGSINLLSGGEKAFIASALYFSILKVRPTPFCVLDEIDASLDDANVTRFASYLRGLIGKTQFIIITHRRGTMEQADILYGVTMQERGVSKILTLNLSDMAKEMKIS